MKRFRQVEVTAKFMVSVPIYEDQERVSTLVYNKLWSMLLAMGADNNMSVTRPEVTTISSSEESD